MRNPFQMNDMDDFSPDNHLINSFWGNHEEKCISPPLKKLKKEEEFEEKGRFTKNLNFNHSDDETSLITPKKPYNFLKDKEKIKTNNHPYQLKQEDEQEIEINFRNYGQRNNIQITNIPYSFPREEKKKGFLWKDEKFMSEKKWNLEERLNKNS